MDNDEIIRAVEKFRAVMDERHALLGDYFQNFPRGCCGDASELLAAYLKDQGLGNFSYVSGWCRQLDDTGFSHAWLEKDDLILDVTVDQFEAGKERPLVTTDQTWHAQFSDRRNRREDADFRSNPSPALHLDVAYTTLCQFLA